MRLIHLSKKGMSVRPLVGPSHVTSAMFKRYLNIFDFTAPAPSSSFQGLEERFDAMHRRQNKTERLTATRFEEVKERIDQLDNRLNHSKTETQARLEELTTRINDQCQRPAATASPDSSSSFRPTTTPLASTRSFIQSFNPGDYTMAV